MYLGTHTTHTKYLYFPWLKNYKLQILQTLNVLKSWVESTSIIKSVYLLFCILKFGGNVFQVS